MKLPEIRNRVEIQHISGEPEGYALRILEIYRERCNEKWIVHGLSEREKVIYDLMNEYQDKRAEELDRAITKLKESY